MAILLLLGVLAGCERVSSLLGRSTLPEMGPRLPASARITFDPSVSKAVARYANACNQPEELRIGAELEAVLLEAAHRTFQTVQFAGSPPGSPPDVEILIALQQSGLQIQTDGVYDRLPAELTLEAVAVYRDSTGNLLGERTFKTTRREKIIVEPTQRRCAYVTMDSFLHDAAVALSTQFMRESRALLEPLGQSPTAAAQPASAPSPSKPTTTRAVPTLSFKATLLDENRNSFLEGGERLRLRVEVINSGSIPAHDASVVLSGTPTLVRLFPASVLPIGTLPPGETRSIEFATTLPQSVPAQQVELLVSLSGVSLASIPASQTIAALMRPSAGSAEPGAATGPYDDVDAIPTSSSAFQQPHAYLISIGISAHRDQQVVVRKYAAADAELVAAYFQTLGGIPAANVRTLQDGRALRPDIEEAILDWLPSHVTADSLVILYFSGQAKVSHAGDVFLVPYEGGTSTSRLYSLKSLQAALSRLKARQIMLIFDGAVSRLDGEARGKGKDPRWEEGSSLIRLIGTSGLQSGLEPETLRHGLFTYYLLRGLKGEADENLNGEVTLGELVSFLQRAVPAAARSAFHQDQRPLIIPMISPGTKLADVTLTKTASTSAASR